MFGTSDRHGEEEGEGLGLAEKRNFPCPKCGSPVDLVYGPRSAKPVFCVCTKCELGRILRYEEAAYSGKTDCEICSFTVGTGDMWSDHVEFMKHWDTHSENEKERYFNSLPKSERTSNPLYGWENRMRRMSDDIRRLEETLLFVDKRPVEERLAFKMRLQELQSRWMWFEDYLDLCFARGFFKREEG